MKLHIKYMVSIRCKMIVEEKLKNFGLNCVTVDLGEVDILEELTDRQREKLKTSLLKSGLLLMDDKRAMLIEKIKNAIITLIHHEEEIPKVKFSHYLSEKLDYNYTYLANIFSETQGITIEQFVLLHKIERVKELIIYDELNLTEISHKLNYSSVGALSSQFKKITGLTPSFYKRLKEKRKENIENV